MSVQIYLQRKPKNKRNPKASRRKKIIKIRAELNEIEIKKTMQKMNTQRCVSSKRLIKLTNLWLDLLRKKRKRKIK